ncbi:LacI family DNA-binding transcriptional regulator [Microlunatus soli]|uniref:Transcriptional regulator, LacI family n=1 Tax=Microlunatus soli TaxID=630515 RepID=A0A1H1SAK8_9ACTN|nr:substrate-binding domain-containing protein [Microlunatus soli]SDS44982.1 transcriptional regulator, LacI family [Microlunatus soli]
MSRETSNQPQPLDPGRTRPGGKQPAPNNRRVSRGDVAARAGVSHGTVSHVLNHPDRVRPETRQRVEAAIAELGFVRDEAARHLRAGYSTTIGLMLLDAFNPSFMDVARGVDERTAGERWTVLMSNSARDSEREARYLQEYASRRVAGLIVIPNDRVDSEDHRLPDLDTPMVVVDRAGQGAQGLSVAIDDITGGGLIADHLAGLGHRRIAFVGHPDAALPVRTRYAGFRQRLIAIDPDLEPELISAPLSFDAGVEIGRELALRPVSRRPTAVATAVDVLAFGVLKGVQSAGLEVPADLSIAGYDDIPFTAQLSAPLTSVRRPHHRMGQAAADLLLQVLDGRTPPQRHLMLEPELIIRASTAAPPGV